MGDVASCTASIAVKAGAHRKKKHGRCAKETIFSDLLERGREGKQV